MLGADHGQIFNASKLGSSLGVDHKTVSRICDHLEGAFLLRRLQPWSGNIRKRLVRRPKLYWRDSGQLHASMMVSNRDQLYRQPWLGSSWESMVIEQTLAHCDSLGLRVAPYFFRSSDGYEIDLVLERGAERWAIEVKLTSNPTRDHLTRLNTVADLISAGRRFLICRVDQGFGDEHLRVCNLSEWLQVIAHQA